MNNNIHLSINSFISFNKHDYHGEQGTSIQNNEVVPDSIMAGRDAFPRVSEEINNSQNIQLWVSRISLVVLLFLSSLLYRLYYQKQKAYLGLYHQIKEHDRLSYELEQVTKQYEYLLSKEKEATSKEENNDNIKEAGDSPKVSDDYMQKQQLVTRLRHYVLYELDYLQTDIDREKLITTLSTNRTSLSEAVRTITNKTLMEYINFLRLEEAKAMLDKHSELTVEAIAEKFGFNLRTFHRLFYNRYHVSPDKYRRIQRQVKE